MERGEQNERICQLITVTSIYSTLNKVALKDRESEPNNRV